jgi:hypothetical protein
MSDAAAVVCWFVCLIVCCCLFVCSLLFVPRNLSFDVRSSMRISDETADAHSTRKHVYTDADTPARLLEYFHRPALHGPFQVQARLHSLVLAAHVARLPVASD